MFLGVTMPNIRKVARMHRGLSLEACRSILRSEIHEERMLALVILVEQFKRAGDAERRAIYALYGEERAHINNWDLVDTSAPAIVGGYLESRSRKPLYSLARSTRLWDRRVAMLATFYYIRQGDFTDAIDLAERLLGDAHDLMHKAVGWMLREIGKRDQGVLEAFLNSHAQTMPRTMLRYAIEKLPEAKRRAYLRGGDDA